MSENARITVNSGVKKIQVNDEGECILLPVGDQAFMSELLTLMQDLETISTQQADRAAEIDKMPEGTQKEDVEKAAAVAASNLEICNKIKTRVDETFHDEVCRKVFGNITPSILAFSEFFDQLGAIISEYMGERKAESQRRIAKYTAKYHE